VNSEDSLGILDIMGSGAGFIRRREASYLAGDGDIYVGNKIIQRFGLRTGDEIVGEAGNAPAKGKNPPLVSVSTVNGVPAEDLGRRPDFNRMGAVHPNEQLVLECDLKRNGKDDATNRIIDLFCPFGKGQRAMIVAPAKAGKTMVLQAVAEGIVKNFPKATVLILLVDERPEEVTEMEMHGYGEVIASSFDHPADRHVGVAEITLERARREELLMSPEMLKASHKLRRDLSDLSATEAMEQIQARMRRTATNTDLVQQIITGRA
jgi:transcription termination factor Rho